MAVEVLEYECTRCGCVWKRHPTGSWSVKGGSVSRWCCDNPPESQFLRLLTLASASAPAAPDAELRALGVVIAALAPLPEAERQRVLRYAGDRFDRIERATT